MNKDKTLITEIEMILGTNGCPIPHTLGVGIIKAFEARLPERDNDYSSDNGAYLNGFNDCLDQIQKELR